jgi:glycosyltransferase involved in cell wall biosynthesis
MNIRYSLVIPCFNESGSLEILISEIRSVPNNAEIEFILVDNGSTDSTPKIFNTILDKNILKLRLERNKGYGGGIKAGLAIARGEYVGWIHADLQYSLIDSLSFLNHVGANNKYIKGRRKGRTFFQNFISANMSLFETLLFGHLLYDINAQPTIFHKDMLVDMAGAPNDFSIDLYSYVVAKKRKFKVARYKVYFKNRTFGKSTWNSGLKSIITMSVRTITYSMSLRRVI